MRRCAIPINSGQPGHNQPGTASHRYVTGSPTNINDLNIDDIPNLYAFLQHQKITSKYLPHVDRWLPIPFDCRVRLLDIALNGAIIPYITSQMGALEDLANSLEDDKDLSTEQQAFITESASGGGNGQYWEWFMELKCAVALVELTV
ncbi:uncharacterized protein FPRN_15205 [Fusarium proliferatum]|nr:uncharacterized protein FPRN_15205 [Fusarium proliferatum]